MIQTFEVGDDASQELDLFSERQIVMVRLVEKSNNRNVIELDPRAGTLIGQTIIRDEVGNKTTIDSALVKCDDLNLDIDIQ